MSPFNKLTISKIDTYFLSCLFSLVLGQKRPSEGNSGLVAKKQKRTPKRTSAVAKSEKNGTGRCFPMLALA